MQIAIRRSHRSISVLSAPDSGRDRWTYFARQLGLSIAELSQSTDIVRRVLTALHLISDGREQRGRALLASDKQKQVDESIDVSGRHAFIYTELLRFIESPRIKLLLQELPIEWIREVDNTVYELLNTSRRSVRCTSVAGIMMHYQAEKRAGNSISEPQVGAAVAALSIQSARNALRGQSHDESSSKSSPATFPNF
jgi:hypothetical protein